MCLVIKAMLKFIAEEFKSHWSKVKFKSQWSKVSHWGYSEEESV